MKKGFTLVELLGVIIILGVIATLTIPAITGIIKNNKEKVYNEQINNIIDAAKNWSLDNVDYLSEDNDNYVSLNWLLNGGYLENNNVKDPRDNSTITGCIKISYSSNYNQFEYSYGKDYSNCMDSIYDIVTTKFPQLIVGSNGCATPTSGSNYSYMGGCYLAGAHTDNYLWYSGFLWRIMGVNSDNSIKMITEEGATAIAANNGSSTSYSGSYAEDWLNNYFSKHLRDLTIIQNGSWCDRGTNYITDSSSSSITCSGVTINDNIGMLSLDEYNLAGGSSSYLVNKSNYWTLSPYNSTNNYRINGANSLPENIISADLNAIRPIINVKYNIPITSGNGNLSSTWDNTAAPYILLENKSYDITGSLNKKSVSGEYVKYANKIYRVVGNDSTGNTKLVLDSYYQATAGTNYTNIFNTTSSYDITTTSGIGYKLNNDVLNYLVTSTDSTNLNKLVAVNWYQNILPTSSSYTVSLNESSSYNVVNAKVGLLRIGEMLGTQSLTILNKNNTTGNNLSNVSGYWVLTANDASSYGFIVYASGGANSTAVSSAYAIRPVIVIKAGVQITAGSGTPSNPYQI